MADSLQSILDARKAQWAEKAPDSTKKAYNKGIADVIQKGVLAQAKQLGDQAPDFSLFNATNQSVRLADLLQDGPVILTWYRGGWCPYCNLTLRRLQDELARFQVMGATLIALTPELADKSLSTQEKNDLSFEVLSDLHNAVAKEYGVVFSLTPEVADMYQKGFDLHGYNDDESNELPLAATYVIDRAGTIRYAFLDAEYRHRAEPEDLLQVLEQLKNES
ncbi:MAG: peroxiredoxin-like family protein [Bacteroidia bacterium]